MSLIGVVVLVGIVVNDAIIKVDFINQVRKPGPPARGYSGGGPQAPAPHPHDHGAGTPAHGPGPGCRRRTAPSAGDGHHRWPTISLLSNADVVAGDLFDFCGREEETGILN